MSVQVCTEWSVGNTHLRMAQMCQRQAHRVSWQWIGHCCTASVCLCCYAGCNTTPLVFLRLFGLTAQQATPLAMELSFIRQSSPGGCRACTVCLDMKREFIRRPLGWVQHWQSIAAHQPGQYHGLCQLWTDSSINGRTCSAACCCAEVLLGTCSVL